MNTGRRRFKTGRLLLWVGVGLAIGCSGDGGGDGTPPPPPGVALIEVTPTSLLLTVGGNQQLTATPRNASGGVVSGVAVSWSTSNPGVASVSQNGTVQAAAVGTATVTASAGGKQQSVNVTVVSGGGGATGTINVNPNTRYQTISGWEAHAESGHETASFPAYRNALFDAAVNDLGINRLRLEIRSGSEYNADTYMQWRRGQIDNATWRCVRYATVNDNSDPRVANAAGFHFSQLDSLVENVVLPMRQRLQARGEQLFLNLLYVAFTAQITGAGCSSSLTYNHDDSAEEYAEFILVTSEHLRSKYNLTPDAWEVILEPDNTNFWRGPTIGAAIVATAARLSAAGFTPRFIAPSTTRSFNAVPYFDAMIQAVPASEPLLYELSYHRYSSVTDSELQTFAARAAQYGFNTSMLEHIASGHEDLHKDLKLANVSSWEQLALGYPSTDNGAQYYTVDVSNPSNPVVNIASRTKYLRQYFKFIRAGAVRIAATSANAALDPLAFINTNGGYVVVVKATAGATFTVGGLPAGQYGIKYTTATAYDSNLADVNLAAGQALSASIPAAGVVTIYRK